MIILPKPYKQLYYEAFKDENFKAALKSCNESYILDSWNENQDLQYKIAYMYYGFLISESKFKLKNYL